MSKVRIWLLFEKKIIASISDFKGLRIISFSVVNMAEKLRCFQLDLVFFSMVGKNFTVYKTKLGNDLFEGIIKRKKNQQFNLTKIIKFSVCYTIKLLI